MFIRVFFYILFGMVSQITLIKAESVESLKLQLIDLPQQDKRRTELLNELALHYLYKDPKLAVHYAEQAVPLATSQENDGSRAVALRLLGQAQMYQGLNEKAFTHLTQAINVANIVNSSHLISVSNRAMGVFYELIIDYDNAMKYYIEALKFAKLSKQPADLAMVYNNLGNVLNAQGDFLEAANYFKQSIEINNAINDLEMAMNATTGLGVSYLKSQQINLAKITLESVLSNEAKISDFTFSEANVNLAHVYQMLDLHQPAIELYKFVISDPRGSAYPQAVAASYLGLAELLSKLKRYDEALEVFRNGIIAVKNKTSVESEMALYENLAKLELKLGQYEAAAKVQAEYISRRNTIQPFTQEGIIKKLESQLQVERDVIKLQEDLLQKERESRHSSLYLFVAIVISLVCLVLFLTLRLRKQAMLRLEAKNHALKIASETDPLTGIGNRRYLDRKLAVYQGKSIEIAFLLIDVDYFKEINDNLGHDVGDEVLTGIASTIKDLCRKEDIFARIGGEEFAILQLNSDKKSSLAFANRVRQKIEQMRSTFDFSITASIGVSIGNMTSANYDDLYKQSDLALYQAKSAGRNKVQEYISDTQITLHTRS
ncbi:GGDEF domain-containing protein [Thalassotalea sp. M1531]|uniref:diguanylate cyclase n=1 Tax=Thalassotalea algicola TaxID=2716224 RepID=A0A7Y0Q8H4_9GAMM|nr:diguanylate cyclase [Thalassotalea algicola]NMP33231.1 GGDEF domain-containing protein [Thalassotalea algicola]